MVSRGLVTCGLNGLYGSMVSRGLFISGKSAFGIIARLRLDFCHTHTHAHTHTHTHTHTLGIAPSAGYRPPKHSLAVP